MLFLEAVIQKLVGAFSYGDADFVDLKTGKVIKSQKLHGAIKDLCGHVVKEVLRVK